jgi:anti-sigma B factor antagonist
MEDLESIKDHVHKLLGKVIQISLTSIDDSTLLIKTVGEYNMEAATNLSKAFRDIFGLGYKNLIIDCTEVRYISSTGVGFILEVHKQATNAKGVLILFGVIAPVYSVLQLLGFSQFLHIVGTKEEALTFLRK